MSKRVQAQQDARLALDSLRREIHCAKAVTGTLRPPRDHDHARRVLPDQPTARTHRSRGARWAPPHRSRSGATPATSCSGTGRKAADYLTPARCSPRTPAQSSSRGRRHAYTVGQYVRPTNSLQPLPLQVTAGGTTGATEPTWPSSWHRCRGATFRTKARRVRSRKVERQPAGRPSARRCEAAVHAQGRHRPAQHTAVMNRDRTPQGVGQKTDRR